jgi:hypothetical protein
MDVDAAAARELYELDELTVRLMCHWQTIRICQFL